MFFEMMPDQFLGKDDVLIFFGQSLEFRKPRLADLYIFLLFFLRIVLLRLVDQKMSVPVIHIYVHERVAESLVF